MTQEQKKLLLKDLCARLPYRVMCKCDEIKAQGVLKEISLNYNMCRLYDSFTDEYENCVIFDCRPYLFPLSSMTNEQYEEMSDILLTIHYSGYAHHFAHNLIDWYNKNHFDYRKLIKDGLAIDATGLNIY